MHLFRPWGTVVNRFVFVAKAFAWAAVFVLVVSFALEKLNIYSFDVPFWVLLLLFVIGVAGLLFDKARGS